MINWREGRAGFVGAAKRLIKGVFSYSYSKTSAFVAPPDKTFGITSIIQEYGRGALSAISADGKGSLSTIYANFSATSIIQEDGRGVSSTMTSEGESEESEI